MNLPNFDDRFLHYGYFIGINSYDFKFEYEKNYYWNKNKDVEVISNTGFNVGLVALSSLIRACIAFLLKFLLKKSIFQFS